MKPKPPPLPELNDRDLEEIFGKPFTNPDLPMTVYKLSRIPREKLDAMPYIERQQCCAAKDCPRQTTVRDYGHATHVYWHRRWSRRDNLYLCGKHTKQYRGWVSMIYHERPSFELRSREEALMLLGGNPVNFST